MLCLPRPRNAVVNDGVRVAVKGQGHGQNTEDRQATSGRSALVHPHCAPGLRQGLGVGGAGGVGTGQPHVGRCVQFLCVCS